MTRIRSPRRMYRLTIDPERVDLTDTIDSWIMDLLIKAGGSMPREAMVSQFTKILKRKRPKLTVRPTSVLSTHQRALRDRGLIQITDERGRPIPTKLRALMKGAA